MTKTTWCITDTKENESPTTVDFTYYHFGKAPTFPAWYMKENHYYEIEMIWNFKIIATPKTFFKCLFHYYTIN